MARMLLLVATRKGAWLFRGDSRRRAWRVDGPHFLGQTGGNLHFRGNSLGRLQDKSLTG